MTDEKKADETKPSSEPEPDWLEQWKKDGRMEQALRLEVLILQRDKLNRELEYDAAYFEDWQTQNSPGARREWQRHQVATTIFSSILCGTSGTIEERIRLARDADYLELASIAFSAAEIVMLRREQLKSMDEGTAPGTSRSGITVDLYREHDEAKDPSK